MQISADIQADQIEHDRSESDEAVVAHSHRIDLFD